MQIESQLKRLEAVKKIITEGDKNMFNVVIRSSDSIRVAALRKNYKTKDDAYIEIEKIRSVLPKNLIGRRAVVINYETEYRETDFDLAACVEIIGSLPGNGNLTDKMIEFNTDVASLICKSTELDEAYRDMTRQLEEKPAQIISAFYEIYHDDGTVELKVPVCKLSQLGDRHRDDNIDLPFENDEDAVGMWKFLDNVPSEDQFVYGDEKSNQSVWLHKLYFLPGGERYWAVVGWTKGYLYTASDVPKQYFRNVYKIKNVVDKKLMFIEMKDNEYDARGGMSAVWVYEKVSDKAFMKSEICIRDNIDLPFVPDNDILGAWKVRDFVIYLDNFNCEKQNWPKEELFFQSAEFTADGKVRGVYGNNTGIHNWTKGFLLDKVDETASAYEIKLIDGKEYLFIEWKTGDYQFGGGRIYWYIFVRA